MPSLPTGSGVAVCAAAMMTRDITACALDRITAIRKSTNRQVLDVFLLVGTNSTLSSQLLPPGVILAKQNVRIPRFRGLYSFGDERSNLAKPAFLLWAKSLAPRYKWIFHVEEDAVFTGPWRLLFDTNSTADIWGISRWRNFRGWAPMRGCAIWGHTCEFHWNQAQGAHDIVATYNRSRHRYGEYPVRSCCALHALCALACASAQLVPCRCISQVEKGWAFAHYNGHWFASAAHSYLLFSSCCAPTLRVAITRL